MWKLPSLDRIGPEQFADLFKSTPIATLGQLVNATIVAIALYSVADPLIIGLWWVLNLIMCSWTLTRWYKNRRREITSISRKAIPRAVLSGFLYALPWSMLVILYLGEISPLEELIVGIAVIGMAAAGSVQLARIYPAALAYLGTILVPVIVKSIFLGSPQYYLLAGLSVSYIIYLFSIVANAANASIERTTALKDLENKIVEIDEANIELEKIARTDDLTGLPNRRVFHEQLQNLVSEARVNGNNVCLLVCDLDHFKNVNDVSGHEAGDQLLCEISRRLQASVGPGDTVARLGGDEFAIIIGNGQDHVETSRFIKRLINRVNQPVDLEFTRINPGISIGVSIFPKDAVSYKELLSHADIALQRGKSQSRGQFWFFDHNLRSKMTSDAALEVDLREAMSEEQFEMFYQPKIDIRTGQLIGLESLLRWRRPNGDVETPILFFPVAESRGLMPYISDFVIDQVIDDIANWRELGFDPGDVAINIHPVQIKDRHRMQRLAEDVENSAVSANNIILEITEECVVGRGTDEVPGILRFMRYCKFKISLDDFGTGYASLTHLKTLPVNEIKIDRSFIKDLGGDMSNRSIVHAMIKLASSLGLTTVAEGIEDQMQHNILLAMGCDVVQGYFYGKPMDLEATTQYLRGITNQNVEKLVVNPLASRQVHQDSSPSDPVDQTMQLNSGIRR